MKHALLLITFLVCFSAFTQNNNNHRATCVSINQLITKIRDSQVQQPQAQADFKKLIIQLEQKNPLKQQQMIFPVQGYQCQAIGGKQGNGYKSVGYSFFDGNKHKGHPAHDIFILDKNQDCIDDKTGKNVAVVAVSNGIVVGLDTTWETNSLLRGGKYIWIYSRAYHSLFYYAHLSQAMVGIGDAVQAGQPIGYVGRTGLNAYKKRSPTHLHFMQLKLTEQYIPEPINPFSLLCK
jgi:murein DD-endopeptidase MepM/ murein hydrolase activator NlpD